MLKFILNITCCLLVLPVAASGEKKWTEQPAAVSGQRAGFYDIAVYKRWEVGLSFGGYKANKHTAFRYDGWDGEYTFNRGVDYYLSLAPNNPYSVYNRIKASYGDRDFTLATAPYPENMRYNWGVNLGAHFGYRYNEFNTLFVDVDFNRLTLNDAITFELEDPANQTSDPLIEVAGLTGKESRMMVNVGLHIGLGDDHNSTPYVEFGANLTSARVIESALVVQERKYILTQWNRNNGNTPFNGADYGGIGFGGFLGAGYRFKFYNRFLLDAGATGTFAKINIGPDLGQKFKLQTLVYLRIIWA